MLKLPKGLKKKKKGKKSKKDQELFTEEELEQYKREHQSHPEVTSEESTSHQQPAASGGDEEWSKFAALTTGVDSILKKTQGDLDRIKSTSFFQRKLTANEQQQELKHKEEEAQAAKEAQAQAEALRAAEEAADPVNQLLNAVVELSESEEESDAEDGAFDTTFVDQELPLAYIPDEPEDDFDLGPDPFDTAYAEKVIKGPEVSKRGKRLVNIGAAVEVLTGKVETAAATAAKSRRQRRGIQNLLLESFEANSEDTDGFLEPSREPETFRSLLDDPADLSADVNIDLSVSLHLSLQKEHQKHQQEEEAAHKQDNSNILDEFDALNKDDEEDDEFAQLAAESLTKTDEINVIDPFIVQSFNPETPQETSWAEFQVEKDDDDFDLGPDPFDTTYVEKIVPKSIDYDDDFDPRAALENTLQEPEVDLFATPNIENKSLTSTGHLTVLRKDLLSNSTTDLSGIVDPIALSAEIEIDEVDPFDTSAVNAIVAPGKTELKFLEKELLGSQIKKSLSDEDFDPRAEEPPKDIDSLRQRKSSLSLQITSSVPKLVSFSVATPDLLRVDGEQSGKHQKPLTPYYNRKSSLLDNDVVESSEDPFDTSFVPTIAPSTIELDLLEKEILKESKIPNSLSDEDFNPRAVTPQPPATKVQQADLFLAVDVHDIKVLTPAKDSGSPVEEIDPFDTSIAHNIQPGSAELKQLEDELIEKKPEVAPSADILSDTQDNSIYSKILTPQPSQSFDLENQEDFDPFDTTFASNLAPGQAEIKVIEIKHKTSEMANPFLFMEDDSTAGAPANDAYSNPFLVEDDGQDDEYANDNPFFSGANNPFAGFGDTDEDGNSMVTTTTTTAGDMFPADNLTQSGANFFLTEDDNDNSNEQHIDSTMSFFGTTINEHDGLQYHKPSDLNVMNQNPGVFDDSMNAYSSEEELKSKKPPRPNPPPSHATQQLIHSLTDHLDQTSTNLLGKLPVTRSPSPISMRDLHSPSPTQFDDLLDVSEAPKQQPSDDQNNFFDLGSNDNSFAPIQPVMDNPFVQAPVEVEHKPMRPPPPRPLPPRPSPPKSSPVTAPTPVQPVQTAPVTQVAQQQQDSDDLFDFFGTAPQKKAPPKPAPPKSKEDILSLFSAPVAPVVPVQQQQHDLLSDDIMDFVPVPQQAPVPTAHAQPIVQQTYEPPVLSETPFIPEVIPENIQEIIPETIPEEIVEVIPEPVQKTMLQGNYNNYPIPTIEEHLEPNPPAHLMEDDEYEEQMSKSEFSDNPTPSSFPDSENEDLNMEMQQEIPAPTIYQAADRASKFFQDSDAFEAAGATYQAVIPPEAPVAYHEPAEVNPFLSDTTPPEPVNVVVCPLVAQPELAPIFNDDIQPAVVAAKPFIPPKPAPPRPPVRYSSVLTTVPAPSPVPDAVFDDFSAKFESKPTAKVTGNAFLDSLVEDPVVVAADAWGDSDDAFGNTVAPSAGFDNDEVGFDSWAPPVVPGSTPFDRKDSDDDDDLPGKELHVVIRPIDNGAGFGMATPALGPPPRKSPYSGSVYSGDSSPRVNPFDSSYQEAEEPIKTPERRDSQDSSPPTPLFDEDCSQPLEDFPRIFYVGEGWEMQLRQPNKKKITGQRFWKKIWVRLVFQGDNPVVQLMNSVTDKEPFQELPLQACYSVSDIAAQQFDNFGKIFTLKLQYVFYKERPGVRPGQVTKAERLTTKLSGFVKYAIDGDYQGCKEFGSDLKKLGLPVEHAPQMSQLFKLGSMNYEDLKQFSMCIEEALFKLNVHRDRALTYKMEEVQLTAVDELYVEQSYEGSIIKQIARVRLFFLGFLSGMPDIELGVNDLWRQGKEVVGRHDIIPVVTEEWIRLEGVEFHACVQQDEYERTRTIKFKPPDACYIELMRFRIRPPKNRELPLQLKATWIVTGNKVRLQADVLVPGFASRKLGQIPCEDVSIRFPIPECWIYLFRVEKHFRYGSVKSTHRRTGKIKGIERFLGTVETLQESLIEVTSGQAKYEHHHRAIVWRCPRLPKEGQGAYTTHQMVCRLALTSYDQVPEQLAPFAFVEFTMPATQASHTTVRSVSVQESDSDEPPEKYVRYLARHEYKVGIEHTFGESQNAYLAATTVKPQPIKEEPAPMEITPVAPSDSDSDSN
ncbi:unnamed protein product [Diamesa hyperborea]